MFPFYLIIKLAAIGQKDIVRTYSVRFPEGAMVALQFDLYTDAYENAVHSDR